jgi:methionyl-tRNA formyltransferase
VPVDFFAEGVDTGDIIEQIPLELDETEDVGDALRKLLPLYDALTRRVATALRTGPVEGRPQDPALATEYPRRTPEDGRIDWKRSALQVRDLVRAVAAPYPGAFTDLPDGRRLFIWKAAVEQAEGRLGPAGTILSATGDRSFLVSCGAGSVRVLSWSATPGAAFSPRAGTVLP